MKSIYLLGALVLCGIFIIPGSVSAKSYSTAEAFARHQATVLPLTSCGNGNDFYDGGDDTDTIEYSGKRSEFYVTLHTDKSYTFKDLVACRADTDTVVNVEKFQFSSGTLNIKSLKPNKVEAVIVNETVAKSSSKNSFTLSGEASGSTGVFVALLPEEYRGPTDWHTIYTNDSYVAFTGDTIVNVSKKGKWKASFLGVPGGTYQVLVYDNSSNITSENHKLLGMRTVKLSAPTIVKFKANANKTITVGVGQTASDGGLEITLTSVAYSDGLTGVATAYLSLKPKGFDTSFYPTNPGTWVIPNGGSLYDHATPTGAVKIWLSEVSVPRNTASFKIIPVAPKG